MLDAQRPLPRRLRKRVAESLRWSLQEVDACWFAGRLRVIGPADAEPRLVPLESLVFEDDAVLLDGTRIERTAEAAYVLLNKPKQVTSSARDPDGKRDLSAYLRAMPPGCAPVGRLDRDTTGLLLCTNDGELANAVLRPDHQTKKTYWLWLDDELTGEDPRLRAFVNGVPHQGQVLRAQSARITAHNEHATELELCLTQGKKRQIRHMCRALDLHLVHLHRRQIGPLSDAGLALGEWRAMSSEEVEALWHAAGGRSHLRARKVAALRRHSADVRAAGSPHTRLEHWLRDEDSRTPPSAGGAYGR